jgi:hypothetical protein
VEEILQMRNQLRRSIIAISAAAACTVFWLAVTPTVGQAQAGRTPRTADGKPNLNGIWQSLNTGNWDLEGHAAKAGPVVALGAAFSEPAGLSIVEGGTIPYRPAMLAKKKENGMKWLTEDPEVKCFMPGVPRANYQPFPFQIVQSPQTILMAYEFASASRVVRMNTKEESPTDSWMGWSRGRWEGDSLIIDVTGFNDSTWFSRAGDFHTDELHVVEKYSLADADHINYEATIEDAKTFTRPWKVAFPLYRHTEKNAQLLEFKCVEFVEELMYGHLRKRTN